MIRHAPAIFLGVADRGLAGRVGYTRKQLAYRLLARLGGHGTPRARPSSARRHRSASAAEMTVVRCRRIQRRRPNP